VPLEERVVEAFDLQRVSLHRSQISENFDLEDYLIDSGSPSRIRPRDSGADSAAFSEREFSNGLHSPF
jgi:hypothetical protein